MKLFKSLDISRQTTQWVFDNFNYLMFLGFLTIVYIANAHFAEKNVRDIQRTENEIKELKWEYISIKSETMYKSMQSQIDRSLETTGVDLEPTGPKVIVVK
jgi:uncharacterized protein (UPF0333 family)